MQTAVEWLMEKLNKLETEKHLYKIIDYRIKKQNLIEQANEMFEQQIITAAAYYAYPTYELAYIDAEDYYNKTFKK